jgi:hypothetical protein
MYLQRAIVKLMVSAMMLSLPSFLKITTEVMGSPQATTAVQPGSIGELTVNLSSSISQMGDLMGAMGYIMGLMFGMMAMLDFKRHAEGEGHYVDDENESKSHNEETKVNLEKAVEKEGLAVFVDLKKDIQETVISKNENPLDFKNTELNNLVKEILGKVEYLKNHGYLQKNMESALMVEKTEAEYLFRIHKNYMDIPANKREIKGVEDSPYDSTFNQLSLIITGLDEIENKIVKDSVMKQKANEIFLKEKVSYM